MRRATLCAVAVLCLSGCDLYDSGRLRGDQAGPLNNGSAVCGNGRVEPGESCDTQIAAGEPGACPTDCPEDDPCIPQVSVGAECRVECVPLRIEQAWNADGCCPEGVGAGEDSDCGSCGDGIVGPLETCDPVGKCTRPEACAAPSDCLRATFKGAPETCNAVCVLELLTACANGDRCCPQNCAPSSDDDCSDACGDGVVQTELGETCEDLSESDPCARSCDDGDPCTQDLRSGSADNCNVACTHQPITTPQNGDQCCPGGATANNDSDCLPVCGNQVREGGETCDPCPATCDDDDACSLDQASGSASYCTLSCSHTPITQVKGGDDCCPAGANTNTDGDCTPVCGNGVTEQGEDCDGQGYCNGGCEQVIHTSLIHRYRFDGTGDVVTDSAGDQDGRVIGAALSGSGTVALGGGTSGPYVDLPNGIISSLTNATVEVWLTWNGGAAWQRAFDFGNNSNGEGNQGGSGTSGWFLTPYSTAGGVRMVLNFTAAQDDYTNDTTLDLSGPLGSGSLHQMVGVFDDSSDAVRLYVDGALAGSASGVTGHLSSLDDRNVWIGRSNYNDAELNATVFEVRIYGAALSTSQISASFGAGPDP